jgi:hypothetical protein
LWRDSTYTNYTRFCKKIHTSKKFGPFSAIFRQICRIFRSDFLGRSYFYGATFAFCGRNFGRLGTLTITLVQSSRVPVFSLPVPVIF